jgi:hypothetical protein
VRIESDQPLAVTSHTIGRSFAAIPASAASTRQRITAPLSTTCCRADLGVINTTASEARITIVVRDLVKNEEVGQAIARIPPNGSSYFEDIILQLLTLKTVERGAVEVTSDQPVIALLLVVDVAKGDAHTVIGERF